MARHELQTHVSKGPARQLHQAEACEDPLRSPGDFATFLAGMCSSWSTFPVVTRESERGMGFGCVLCCDPLCGRFYRDQTHTTVFLGVPI